MNINHVLVGSLSIGVAFQLGYLIYCLGVEPHYQPTKQTQSAKTVEPASQPTVDSNAIANYHLFGEVITQATKPVEIVKPIKESNRKIRIAGLAVFANADKSSAMLEVKPGDIEFFKIGDRIDKRTRLTQVQTDSVVIEVNGVPERIDQQKPAWPMEKIKRAASQLKKAAGVKYDWSWLSNWKKMTDAQIASALKIGFNEAGSAVCNKGSPFLQAHHISAGDVLLTVNGISLKVDTVKAAFNDLNTKPSLYFMIQNSELQRGVRWRKY